jgi:hypothetical protein
MGHQYVLVWQPAIVTQAPAVGDPPTVTRNPALLLYPDLIEAPTTVLELPDATPTEATQRCSYDLGEEPDGTLVVTYLVGEVDTLPTRIRSRDGGQTWQ